MIDLFFLTMHTKCTIKVPTSLTEIKGSLNNIIAGKDKLGDHLGCLRIRIDRFCNVKRPIELNGPLKKIGHP